MNNWEMEGLVRRASVLRNLGYVLEYNQDGCKVTHNGQFIFGAGVMLPRDKKLHWKHAKKNREDNLCQAVRQAEEHHRKRTT